MLTRSFKDSTDEQLVARCLDGDQDSWVALIHRYQNLIYGVIRSYRVPDPDTADLFQSICVELFHNLPRLRQIGALRRWLITVASHECYRWKKTRRHVDPDNGVFDMDSAPDELASESMAAIERAQLLGEAMEQLPQRCRKMIRLLFFAESPLPYSEVAAQLGLAVGSIGFIRRRCLDKLKSALQAMGF
jgi:RNA polymerase sigma factor (sigma-70 family)